MWRYLMEKINLHSISMVHWLEPETLSVGTINATDITMGTLRRSRSLAENFFDGLIDEAYLWKKALSNEEIMNNYGGNVVLEDELIAHWNFNDGEGNQLTDITGNGNHCIIDNANWSVEESNGNEFAYIPSANYNGTDSFTYSVTDGQLTSNDATVTITINPTNDNPIALDMDITIDEDFQYNGMLSGSDIDGDQLTFSIISGPLNGIVILTDNNTGVFIYTPNENYNGTDSFTYNISDGEVTTETATVTFTINAIDDIPIASDLDIALDEDATISGTRCGC